MHRESRSPLMGLFVVITACLMLIAPAKADFDYAYCSSQNTGTGNPTYSDYQSNGFCTDKCKGSAFAVLLQNDCWCTDYIPGDDQQSVNNCDDSCPGYPTEKCGNKDKKFYVYVKLPGGQPSGTQGGSKPTSSSSPTTASDTPNSKTSVRESKTVVATTTSLPNEATSLFSSPKPISQDPTTFQVSAAPTNAQTSIRTISLSNSVVTETIVTTPTSSPIDSPTEKGSSNTGAIVGGVIGGVVGLAALAGGVFFALWRRRRQRAEGEDDGQAGMQRNVSTMSKSGLLRTEKPTTRPPPIATNVPRRQSRNLDQDSISPISGSDRRNSRHIIDQRLNPSALFVLDNSSQGSVASMDDSRDYHRPLNVRNPDP